MKHAVLGIDTSNYKTSVALISESAIIADLRSFLKVKPGMKGLRQSEAVFQHVQALPQLFERLEVENKVHLDAVAVSSRPRPVDGSYMPCFTVGKSFANSISSFLHIPLYTFSHQEGHIEAARAYSGIAADKEFLACHFSGGTTEILKVTPYSCDDHFYKISIIGGSKDIAYGQVLDRAGVELGLDFPCGEELDDMAVSANGITDLLTQVKVKSCELNLSGIDTQIKKIIKSNYMGTEVRKTAAEFVREIFDKLSDSILLMLSQAALSSGNKTILMSGGVASSRYIRDKIIREASKNKLNVQFAKKGLSSDNAVGIALLGGKMVWH